MIPSRDTDDDATPSPIGSGGLLPLRSQGIGQACF